MRWAGVSQPVAIALVAASAFVIALFSLSRGDARIVSWVPEWLSPIGHFLLYVLFGYACTGALGFVGLAIPSTVVAGVVLATGFGAAMELAQRFRPGRFARGRDVIMDAAGAVLGGVAYLVLATR